MSIRFHKGPSIITLFHDTTSPTSKQVLQLLTNYSRNPHILTASVSVSNPTSSSGSHGESCIVEANGGGADATNTSEATSYLRQAASDFGLTGNAIQLEVVDRQANPPTADQLRSIVDYLAADPTSSMNNKLEPKYTSTGFDLNEHNRRKKALAQHLSTSNSAKGTTNSNNDNNNNNYSRMPKIKDGPLVVNWDEGTAATSLEGVKQMLERLQDQAQAHQAANSNSNHASNGGGGCTIC
ncbi:uncharacterized protein MEPE_05143 [Melanopsichium pennsylvanicum]|uniref:Uncharacterized protein n=2 Tax=Melanopsichium pennsylvanicum TaxID=63383 RepID=A0AAJ4XQ54_9BASI|nr:conserved hypothetical protein [Melanopsichium pennsylvanicum 4]SNX86434.1 uncharacterized protein MEPE_05143 [Melanopsichium pennsylvanicum]